MEMLINNKEKLYKVNEDNIYNSIMNISKDSLDTLYRKEIPNFSFIPAKIIKNSYGTLHNYLIINKGGKDGLTENMGVITPFGVVGIIRAVGENNSYVHSFFNVKQNVSTKIGNTNSYGPMVWNQINTNHATLNEIPQHIKFNIGDTVYTSGMSAFYPPDIPLGTIQSSKISNGIHHSIDVKLFQDPRILNFVIVVKNNNKSEIDSLSRFSER
jgi:Cell shape-determining protein